MVKQGRKMLSCVPQTRPHPWLIMICVKMNKLTLLPSPSTNLIVTVTLESCALELNSFTRAGTRGLGGDGIADEASLLRGAGEPVQLFQGHCIIQSGSDPVGLTVPTGRLIHFPRQ